MDNKQIIATWQDGAQDALDTASSLMTAKKYHHALFFCHLALEKTLKAKVVEVTGKTPPFTHDLVRLASMAKISLTINQEKDFNQIITFNVKGRYDEYKQELYKKATPEYAAKWFTKTKEHFAWLNQK